ncbi:MAG: 1-(5-phosphoribosyl)-5-[(5-phosphoribosylamino)methylideneamino]imidazole-4-carboxamide isomerase [Erysipelotrichaceae bacterium]|jgi:phosphoribosylformimino-5-aminoimidazole carboxamide ribotide isomerase
MILLPAIDIIDGRPVRLYQGDYAKAEQVAEDVTATALRFKADGAKYLHCVDLDGAKAGKSMNAAVIKEAALKSGLSTEVGGGIRTMADIQDYLNSGIDRVILGTAAVEDEALLKEALAKYGKRIAIGIDARDGFVQTAGWLGSTSLDYVCFAKKMEAMGAQNLIVTDISKDGTLSGPAFAMYEKLRKEVYVKVTASGGIHSLEDLLKLKAMGLDGAILGKSLYAGKIDLKEALSKVEAC